MQVDLRYKVAVVTGSSRGIGRAIAEAFAAAGARVWFHGTSDEGRAVADAVGQPYVRADFTRVGRRLPRWRKRSRRRRSGWTFS